MLTKQFIISIFFSLFFLFSACSSHVTTPAETPPTTETTEIPSTTTKTTDPGQVTTSPSMQIVNRTTHGRIQWDETWQGEIHIVGDIIVEEGFTLTIKPGTKVLIAANSDVENLNKDPILMKQGINTTNQEERGIKPSEPYWDEGNHISIKILGTLYAVGTLDQMITITSDSMAPSRYDWNHFNFHKGILSYAVVEYYWALGPGEGAIVSHNILRHIGGCAVCWGFGSAIIEYNTIYDTGHEMIATLNNSHVIRHNHLGPSKENGIVIEGINAQPQIAGNTIEGCEAGIAIISGSPNISGNTIQDCRRGITLLADSQNISIDESAVLEANTFSNNEQDIVYIEMQSFEPPQQTGKMDMVNDVLGVKYVVDGYNVECILPSLFGLSGQRDLLPNGDVVFSDSSHPHILLISDGIIRTVVEDNDIKIRSVAAMPDGRICYSLRNGQFVLIDPGTGAKEIIGQTSPGDAASALAADNKGNVYAATNQRKLYRFTPDGNRVTIATNLPYEQGNHISDIDVAADGTIYIAGWRRFIALSPDGNITTITDDLRDEPTWCEIAPDGKVYIKDPSSGMWRFDPVTGALTAVDIKTVTGVGDFLAMTPDEFLFVSIGVDVIYKYNLTTHAAIPILTNAINSFAFAASSDDTVFLATPYLIVIGKGTVLKSHIVRLSRNGNKEDLTKLTFEDIHALDVDKENRLYLAADDKFYLIESNVVVASLVPKPRPSEGHFGFLGMGKTNIAISPNGLLYCISTNNNDSIQVWTVDKEGKVTLLPISFNRASFGDAYRVGDARIDVGNDGRLALIATALGSKGQGPFYQRVYRADADGNNLTQIANLDSDEIGGMVDIAVGPNGDVFVSTPQRVSRRIHRISGDNAISEFILFSSGRDPKSMDVDANGNLWLCTTVGVFRVVSSR